MHVLMQEETLCQAPGNSPIFALRLGFDTSCHRKGLISEPEGGLLAHFWPRGGSHIRLDLGSWPSVLVGSRIVIQLDSQGGGVFEGASLETLGGCSVVRGGGGGVRLLPWGCYCCTVGQASGKKRSTVIVCLTTISSLP